MEPLTQEQIRDIALKVPGNLRPEFCRSLVCFMAGYLTYALDIEDTRQEFFRQLRRELDHNLSGGVESRHAIGRHSSGGQPGASIQPLVIPRMDYALKDASGSSAPPAQNTL